ncbi:GH39 family glycosyl hydrolase [Luteolibacter luteus]|uniref:Beta-xylosidase n=1 Tax=Luteolibacter luteus TaxID=2728835 RepID=A0A858RIZ0_9BACT|nr:beta-xylosidase [Luteolibacter luteus]QJE96023.1 beta-xylosidase [Luteolibacter luteus]
MTSKTLALLLLAGSAMAESFPVTIRVDAARPGAELKPIWRFFGADEPNYAYMKNGDELLGHLGSMKPKEVFFRAHSLLVTGDGTPALKWGSTNAYTEDAQGKPVYDWTIVDRIFDTYLKNGVRPYVQIGFMPEALSVKPEPYRHHWTPLAKYDDIYTGWAYPPKDWAKWEELVYQWARHSAEKYGKDEVLKWYWETWNEPNIGYWRGSREEFFKLHDHAVRAVRRAIPEAKVGGPDLAGGAGGDFLKAFLDHCVKGKNLATGETGTPTDFISFHAKGQPKDVNGRVQMGIANQLRDIDGAFAVIARYPEFKDTPIVIGESDPEGCAACQGPNLAYRNGTMYSSYTAASFPRKLDLADKHGVNLEGALTWAFEFEDQPYFAGFRSLATNGIDKPVLNVFRMFSKMDGLRLPVASDSAVSLPDMLRSGVRGKPDVSALAAMKGKKMTVLVWHYHDDDLRGPDAEVRVDLLGAPKGLPKVKRYLVDETHSNSFTAWQAMGSPQQPTAQQITELEDACKLAELKEEPRFIEEENLSAVMLTLPRQGVTLLEMEWE